MLNFIFAELADGILKDIIRKREKETQRNPFLQPIEDEIERLEEIEKQVKSRLEVMKQLHRWVSEFFDPPKPEAAKTSPEPEKTDLPEKDEKTQTQEVGKKEPLNDEKIDDGPEESLSEPMLERLKTLEKVIRNYAEKLSKEKITRHFKQIGELHRKLEKVLDCPDDKKESMEYLVGLEATAGEVLDFLCTSKLAGRFNLLKFLRVELSEALANNKKGAEMHI